MGRRASALATSVWTRHTRAPTNPRDAFRNLAPGWEGAAPACPPLCPAPPSTIRRSGEVQSSVAPLPALLHQGGPRHVGPHTQHRCGICQDFRGWSQLGSGQAPIPVQPRSMLSGTKGRVAPLGDFVAQEISPLQTGLDAPSLPASWCSGGPASLPLQSICNPGVSALSNTWVLSGGFCFGLPKKDGTCPREDGRGGREAG